MNRSHEAEYSAPYGGIIRYKRMRFIPRTVATQRYVVRDGDRQDLVAAVALGNSERFWQLCDANGTMRPADLCDTQGKAIAVPGAGGFLTMALLPSFFIVQIAMAPLPRLLVEALA